MPEPRRQQANPSKKVPARRSGKRPPSKRQRRSPKRNVVAVALAVAAAVIAIVVVTSRSGGHSGPAGPEGPPLEAGAPLGSGGAVPPGPSGTLGVQCGSTEVVATHFHIHLAVYVNGQPRSIPLGIGFVGQLQVQPSAKGPFAAGTSDCLYWLHTHATDGIIHVEAPAGRIFDLQQFFGVWGQPLTDSGVGPATGNVTAFVNGKRWTDAIDGIPLKRHESIQLDVGTPVVAPRAPVDFGNL